MKVVRMDSGDELFDRYFKSLEELFKDYTGQFHDIVNYIPNMLLLFLNLHKDKTIKNPSRQIINSVVTYIISPYDVVPEGHLGMYAFADDILLCTIALKRLEDQIGFEVLEKPWNSDEDLRNVIDQTYHKTHILLGSREKEILEFAGL